MLLAGLCTASAEPKFPALTGRIVDEAGLIPPADTAELRTSLAELEKKSSDQLVVVTLKSLQGYDIADYGYQLGRFWKIGQAGTNNGVLLIVAPNERKVRIEVGRGLEPQLTDAITSLIIQNAILPAFRRGDFVAGIKAGVRDITAVMTGDSAEVQQRLARKAVETPAMDPESVMMLMFFLVVFSVVIYQHWRESKLTPAERRRRRLQRSSNGGVIVSPGGWGGSGSWGGGDSGGGGFSGGGGDFGGGGSSGSW